jgi:hypothetical protein
MPAVEAAHNTPFARSARFGIPAHIYVCVTTSGSVILDVERDKYLGLGRDETELLATAVPGWPSPSWQSSGSRIDSERCQAANELSESLARTGVLERITQGEQARVRPALKDMRGEWVSVGDELEIPGRVTLGRIAAFLAAFCWARFSLICRPFSAVVAGIRVRKTRGAGVSRLDIRRLASMVEVFRQLRPFVFAAEGRCLLHALTLIRFLSYYQMYPEWVIGVTTQPWGAHSWVQWDKYLLDTNPEKVCGYTPIMTV